MKTAQRKLKFAVVGCGRISERHLQAIVSDYIDAELVAVADKIEERARSKSEKYGVPYYLDYHSMMARHPEIDVIDILTPTGYHAEHVIDLAQYGRHIIVEKPMALKVEDCDAMIAACQKQGCRLFVVKQNRFNRAVIAARSALESGRFGKLVLGTVRVRWMRYQRYYEQDAWRGTWALDGGVMAQQASHHLDLLQWFMGPIESMQCHIATRLMNIEVEDTAVAIFRFTSGSLGAFEATVATRPEDLEASMSILGGNGSVVIEGNAVNKIKYWRFEKELPDDADIHQSFSEDIPDIYGHGHGPYLAHVVEAIVEGKPALLEADEGKKNVQILTALYESAALGGAPVSPGCAITHSKLGRR
jgi:UDP-N-acetyl-2-amino-2-deoxyglucuronate dehydrogenase